ncbi:MAG: hypothetical protein EOM76_08260 [Sphingobacteriia bacterium]|nr:hypothetical protein [Sphingobacteriia bacterium]
MEFFNKFIKTIKPKHDYWIVNIYANNEGRLTFVPTSESKNQLITELDIHIDLNPPFADCDIQSKLSEAMEKCFFQRPADTFYRDITEKSKATKTYEKMFSGLKLVSVFWDIVDGYLIQPHKKANSRGFQVIEENVIKLEKSSDLLSVVEAIKKAFTLSQEY